MGEAATTTRRPRRRRAATGRAGDAELILGRLIEAHREARGLTPSQLAALCGVTRPRVWSWELSGSYLREDTLALVARVLGYGTDLARFLRDGLDLLKPDDGTAERAAWRASLPRPAEQTAA